MRDRFATRCTGWTFLAAGSLFWGGWMLMPVHIGTYFAPEDFAQTHAHFHWWVWLYRAHIFGLVITAIALMQISALLSDTEARILVWPGAGVATAGTFVTALAGAFYYHHGAWGALELHGKGAEEIQRFIAELRVDTEYVTCLVRFGRVFSGLGLLMLGIGFWTWRLLPRWVGGGAALIGVAAMALTMGLPDHLSLYAPLFHLQALWLIGTGAVLLGSGVRIPAGE